MSCDYGSMTKDNKMTGKQCLYNCNASKKTFDLTKQHSEECFKSLTLVIVLSAIAFVFLSIVSPYPTYAANVDVKAQDGQNETSSQGTKPDTVENAVEQNTPNNAADDEKAKARKELDNAISPGNVDAAEHEPTGTDARPGMSLTPETQQ